MDIPAQLGTLFQSHFHTQPLIVRSPGRVNLIGEHTDYNQGFVLPAALDKATYVAVAPSTDEQCRWVAVDFDDTFTTTLDALRFSDQGWPNYLMGVVDQLQRAGYPVKPFHCVVRGEVPVGAGMSSSASLECAIGFALNELFQLGISRLELVKLAQKAENEFVGVKSGIMDQFASVFGKKDHVIRLDCRSLDYEYFPFRMEGIQIVLLDTGVKHSLASSEYNTRRAQCEAGVRALQRHDPHVQSLRDVSREMLVEHRNELDPIIFNRCIYVVEENGRLLAAGEDLQRGDMEAFGQRMYGSHEGLRDLYEVSCPELDYLVAATVSEPAVLGARMMGGGFGGCTINLIRTEAIPALFEQLRKAYQTDMGRELRMYAGVIEDGTQVIA